MPPPCSVSVRPDRGGLTLACDGALAEPQPAMGTSIKRILEAEAAGGYALEQLQLPARCRVENKPDVAWVPARPKRLIGRMRAEAWAA